MAESESMSESEFVGEVVQLLREQRILPEQYVIKRNANLYYQIIVDNYLRTKANLKHPKRGDSAFQTDLCIFLKKKFVGRMSRYLRSCSSLKRIPLATTLSHIATKREDTSEFIHIFGTD